MSPENTVVGTELHLVGVHELRKRWGWFLALGILLAVLGMMAIGSSVVMTLATMVIVGWLMILSGVFQAAHAFACKAWNGFFIDLLTGLLYAVVGVMIVANPAATAVTLTLLIAILLIFGGVFRIAVTLAVRYPNSLWLLLSGIINLILGISIWQQWPFDGLWVIGMFVGIDMIFNGWSLIMLSLAAKNTPASK
jgi:uncharacterized membrane protein HdeD (DUF308 family)